MTEDDSFGHTRRGRNLFGGSAAEAFAREQIERRFQELAAPVRGMQTAPAAGAVGMPRL